MNKKTIEEAATICDKMSKVIYQRNKGQLNSQNCQKYCQGKTTLINILNKLKGDVKDIEPEYFICIENLLLNLDSNKCINPPTLESIKAIIELLKKKYINNSNKKKIFISHSSKDKYFINGFIKEILKIGCGFKDDDIFCTLDSTVIRTGDDFREKIIENMKYCDYILLFISENYNSSDICKNEMGAAWALEGKRVLPFVLPGTSFEQMGFLNVVKQGASITDKCKLDELYQELCDKYNITSNWLDFNKAKEEFVSLINKLESPIK